MSDTDHIKMAVKEALAEAQLTPENLGTLMDMAANYKAALKLGKWLSGIAIFLSVMFGIWQSIKAIFNK